MKRLLMLPLLVLGISFAKEGVDSIDVIVKSMAMTSFCKTKTTLCPQNRPSEKVYNGMQGKLTLVPVAEEYGDDIYKLIMNNGDILYYSARKGRDIFKDYSGLVKLSSHLKILEDEGKEIIDGSSIVVEKIFMDSGSTGYKYQLSTGQEVWGSEFRSLKALLPFVPKEHEEIFTNRIVDFNINHDKIEDRFFISIKNPLGELNSERLAITPYIGFQDGRTWLRFKFYYTADDWLFINKVLVKTDDDKKVFDNLAFSRDHSGGIIWEWRDTSATEDDIELIERIISSDEADVRFYGKQYYRDRNISPEQKQRLKNMLEVYEMLKNN